MTRPFALSLSFLFAVLLLIPAPAPADTPDRIWDHPLDLFDATTQLWDLEPVPDGLLVAGFTGDEREDEVMVVIKLGHDGSVQWVREHAPEPGSLLYYSSLRATPTGFLANVQFEEDGPAIQRFHTDGSRDGAPLPPNTFCHGLATYPAGILVNHDHDVPNGDTTYSTWRIARYDADGALLWEDIGPQPGYNGHIFAGEAAALPNGGSVAVTSGSGGFIWDQIISGSVTFRNDGGEEIASVRLDQTSVFEPDLIYQSDMVVGAPRVLADGSVAVLWAYGAYNNDVFGHYQVMLRFDTDGNEIDAITPVQQGLGEHWIPSPAGGYVFATNRDTDNLFRLAHDGSRAWLETLGPGDDVDVRALTALPDGGFAVLYKDMSEWPGMWRVARFAPETLPYTLTLDGDPDLPVYVDPAGDEVTVTGFLSHDLDHATAFYLYASSGPWGTALPEVLQDTVVVGEGATVPFEVTVTVPDGAPAGFHALRVHAEDAFSLQQMQAHRVLQVGPMTGVGDVPAVRDRASLPTSVTLAPATPNPFNPATTLRYSLDRARPVRLTVHDLLGRRVAVLDDGWRAAGTHAVVFNGTSLASGSYLVSLQAGDRRLTQRVTLVK